MIDAKLNHFSLLEFVDCKVNSFIHNVFLSKCSMKPKVHEMAQEEDLDLI